MQIQILYDFNLCVIKIITLRSGLNCVTVLDFIEDLAGTCQTAWYKIYRWAGLLYSDGVCWVSRTELLGLSSLTVCFRRTSNYRLYFEEACEFYGNQNEGQLIVYAVGQALSFVQ